MRRFLSSGLALCAAAVLAVPAVAEEPSAVDLKDPQRVATAVDLLIEAELVRSGTPIAPLTSDEDFLRRVTFDLAGTLPSPRDLTLFGLSGDSDKRQQVIERLLESDEFAQNWARYWRDVIFTRATDMRAPLAQGPFESWMTEQLKENVSWDRIASELITATGDVREDGRTALVFAHGGMAQELAAETSRIFVGVQIQCANCHDHPYDAWKRDQFHELAAYFPRIRIQRGQGDNRSFSVVSVDRAGNRGRAFSIDGLLQRFDRNRDGKLTKLEVARSPIAPVFDRFLDRADRNKDKALSEAELRTLSPPGGRGGTSEYYMPDLSDPASRGTQVNPAFFVGDVKAKAGLNDVPRREELARRLTSPDNPWFARALVNRIWAELLGQGFYMPIDDIGPERDASFPRVLDLLAEGFTANGYDLKWLFRTIANTDAYQRVIRPHDLSGKTPAFASSSPTRLRSDQLYSALTKVLGVEELGRAPVGRGAGGYRFIQSARAQFARVFGFDPSTPQEDITGSIPQALFMMNSPLLSQMVSGFGNTQLGRMLNELEDDQDAVTELYLLVLAREPSKREMTICRDYLKEVGNRREAYEDLMWSLLNSSEFLSRR